MAHSASFPLVLGTPELQRQAHAEGRDAYLIEPPVDTDRFAPGVVAPDDVTRARTSVGRGPTIASWSWLDGLRGRSSSTGCWHSSSLSNTWPAITPSSWESSAMAQRRES